MQGSGYLTACFSYATQPGSYVLGVEKFEDVAINSVHNLNRHNPNLLAQRAIDIRAGNIYDIVGALLQRLHVLPCVHWAPFLGVCMCLSAAQGRLSSRLYRKRFTRIPASVVYRI
ncbi:MAG: hypothetical protein HC767_08555 [Akkermansiaceae bacterium]|nr:hypothetical protein [Akkermansiaceae bacterium]